MRLVTDHSLGATACRVPCLVCGTMVPLVQAQIDLDGPEFKAYYHRGCLPNGQKPAGHNSECLSWDCRRKI